MERLRGRGMKQNSKYIVWCLLIISIVGILVAAIYREHNRLIDNQEKAMDCPLVINEILTDNMGGLVDEDGEYTDWIEIYNYGEEHINMEGFGLSDDLEEPYKWQFPKVIIEPKTFIMIRASGKDRKENLAFLHTNFSLSKDGDHLVLTNKQGHIVDEMIIPKMEQNIAYGRKPDGSNQICFFSKATPDETNNKVNILSKAIQQKRLELPVFSHEAGFYNQEIQLELSVKDKETLIFYTLDGSIPDFNSPIYNKPINIRAKENEKGRLAQIRSPGALSIFCTYATEVNSIFMGTVVRARTYKEGNWSDEIATNTYFINPHYSLPIISLVTEQDNLFDYEKGIYIPGEIYQIGKRVQYNQVAANYYQRGKEWEREAHLEFFETDGTRYINQDVGVRISGGYSRAYLSKSFKIYARKEYNGQKTIDYGIFPELKNKLGEPITKFKRLKLRNSGEDFNKTMFKDAFMQSLIGEMALDTQAYRPCIFFINGEYWGIQNIRECLDEYYIEEHYGIDKEDVVILDRAETTKDQMEVSVGREEDIIPYNQLITFVQENDMSKQQNYEYVKSQMDIENFIDYNIAEIYIGNLDWPDNNVRIWRKRLETNAQEVNGEDGRWRWAVYDTDWGFTYSNHNTIRYVLDSTALDTMEEFDDHPINHNQWNTILLQQLIKNEEFKKNFLERFDRYLNTTFDTDYVISRIDEMAKVIESEIEEHQTRWGLKQSLLGKIIDYDIEKTETADWEDSVEQLRQFAIERPNYIKTYLREYFAN